MDRAELQELLEQGISLAEIGRRHGLHESTVGYWVKKHGLKAARREKHAARGGLRREELEALVETGASIAEIATAVDRSRSTVRHWLERYQLRTQGTQGRRASEAARQGRLEGKTVITADCARHGSTTFILSGRGYYRGRQCRMDAVVRRRRKVKRILVEEAGGKCRLCGYDRCLAALEFHHLAPEDKRFGLSHRGIARSLEAVRAEARKCVLLCANCHAEVEAGFSRLP